MNAPDTARLAGRVALVIGGVRGIGRGIADRLADEGASVVVADALSEGSDTLGLPFVSCDISTAAGAETAVAFAVDRFGGLDILVQNAGIYPWTLIEDTSPEEWDAVLGVNLRGCFLAARMIFTSSITGPRVTSPGHGHYSASKAGINGFIRAAALEFSGYGITVNGVEPGNILTEGMQAHRSPAFIAQMEAAVPLGRLGTPADVAGAVYFLASDDAAYVTGTTIVVDGGQILPEGADFRLGPG
jgi:3-oxoacyl-[acyl-carrier protein] reductase